MNTSAWSDDAARGGERVFHAPRGQSRPVRTGLMVIAALIVAVPSVRLWRTASGYDAYAVSMLTLAEANLAMGYRPDAGQEVRLENGDTAVTTISNVAAYGPWRALREEMIETLRLGAWLGAKTGFGIAVAMFAWWRWRASRLGRPRRGTEPVTARQLRRRVDPLRVRALRVLAGAPAPCRIAGVPYPGAAETRHTLVSGIAGSGRTALISDLVRQIRRRGERCVIYDRTGACTGAFFDPGRDVLLSPLDVRMPRWAPFFEARGPRDFDAMAEALIAQPQGAVDPIGVTAARQVFSNAAAVLWRRGETNNRALVEHLLKSDLADLAKAMNGSVARSILDPANREMALSVRAMLAANLGVLGVLPDTGAAFSIRRWFAEGREDSCLFLAAPGDRQGRAKGLICAWLEIAVDALLSLEHDESRRLWVIMDDLSTLSPVPSLRTGLAEGGASGGCFVLGVQAASALRDVYGENGADILSGLCGTRVVFAAPDRDTAIWAAEGLGSSDAGEHTIGVTGGAGRYRDGVTLVTGTPRRPVVAPWQIMRLANRTGYLRFPGPCPVARFGFRDERRPRVAPRFLCRARFSRIEPGFRGGEDDGQGNRKKQRAHGDSSSGAPASANGNRKCGESDTADTPLNGEADQGWIRI